MNDLVPSGSRRFKLLVKLIPSDDRSKWKPIVWGLLSGFPWCCIRFYAFTWRPFGEAHGFDAAWEKWPQQRGSWLNVGHVQCTPCRQRLVA